MYFLYLSGSEEEVLQHGGGHERKDSGVLSCTTHEQVRVKQGTYCSVNGSCPSWEYHSFYALGIVVPAGNIILFMSWEL